jgi:hypothetical protein
MKGFENLIAEIERTVPLKEGADQKSKFKEGDIVYGSGSTSQYRNVKYPLTVIKVRGDGTYILGSFTERLSSSGLYHKAPFAISVDEKDIASDTLIEEEDTFSGRVNEGRGEVIFASRCKYTLEAEHDIDVDHYGEVLKNPEGYLSVKIDGRVTDIRYAEGELGLYIDEEDKNYTIHIRKPIDEIKKFVEKIEKSDEKLKNSINEINQENFIEIPLKFAPKFGNDWDRDKIYGFIKNKETSVMEVEGLKSDYKEEEGGEKFFYAILSSSIGKRNIVLKYKNSAIVFFNVEEGDLEIKNIETIDKSCRVFDGVCRGKRNFPPVVIVPVLKNIETFKI